MAIAKVPRDFRLTKKSLNSTGRVLSKQLGRRDVTKEISLFCRRSYSNKESIQQPPNEKWNGKLWIHHRALDTKQKEKTEKWASLQCKWRRIHEINFDVLFIVFRFWCFRAVSDDIPRCRQLLLACNESSKISPRFEYISLNISVEVHRFMSSRVFPDKKFYINHRTKRFTNLIAKSQLILTFTHERLGGGKNCTNSWSVRELRLCAVVNRKSNARALMAPKNQQIGQCIRRVGTGH